MLFLKKYGLWILLALVVVATWYFYSQAQKAKEKAVQQPAPNVDYLPGDQNLDGVVDYMDQ